MAQTLLSVLWQDAVPDIVDATVPQCDHPASSLNLNYFSPAMNASISRNTSASFDRNT
jgi:hypothetical protein